MSMLSEMGVNVVEDDDEGDEPDAKGGELVEVSGARDVEPCPLPLSSETLDFAPMTPCACICVKWGRSNCCRSRSAKLPSPSGSRPGANTMIAGLCGKPADLCLGHHNLAGTNLLETRRRSACVT